VIASAFQVVVFLERRRQPDGSVRRSVTEIVEVNGFVTDGQVNQRPIFRVKDGRLQWTGNWPHERIKRRLYEAGFSDDDIQGALGGRGEWWRRGED
jgi:hypothetical protein